MFNTHALAQSPELARLYLLERRADTEALVASGVSKLPYVAVHRLNDSNVLVGSTLCASTLCAIAVILRRFW